MPPEQIGFAKIEITVRLTVHFFLLLIIVHEMKLNGNSLDILCIITVIESYNYTCSNREKNVKI